MADLKTNDTDYPTGLDTFTSLTGSDLQSAVVVNHFVTAVLAIEAELGCGLKGSRDNLAQRLRTCISANGGIQSGLAFPNDPVDGQLFRRYDYTPPRIYQYTASVAQWRQFTTDAQTLNGYEPTVTPTENMIPLGTAADASRNNAYLAEGWIGASATPGTANAVVRSDANGMLPGSWFTSYTSSDQTVTLSGTLTLPHGLGVAPVKVSASVVFQSTVSGYTAGDIVFIGITNQDAGASTGSPYGMAVTTDATNINVKFAAGSAGYWLNLHRKDTGVSVTFLASDVKVRFYAWA